MIHVLTYPDRWIDWLRYQIWGTMPTVSGEDMRSGPGMIEIIDGDTCTMIPTDTVLHIYFDSGYKSALAKVRQEANENAAIQFGSMVSSHGPDGDLGEDVPYDKKKVPNIDDSRCYM